MPQRYPPHVVTRAVYVTLAGHQGVPQRAVVGGAWFGLFDGEGVGVRVAGCACPRWGFGQCGGVSRVAAVAPWQCWLP